MNYSSGQTRKFGNNTRSRMKIKQVELNQNEKKIHKNLDKFVKEPEEREYENTVLTAQEESRYIHAKWRDRRDNKEREKTIFPRHQGKE